MAIKYSRKVAILTIAIFSILSGGTLSAQQNQTYRLPLNLPPSLSGNYGELRATHFHGGLDFRIGGVAGAPVYAVKDGFVSRISVSPSGYGQAIYIKHPDGKTTVYGHLLAFSPKIEKLVREKQYEQESFAVTITPDSTQIPVKRGELIARAGNTGSSGGPHLHFEIRETNSEIPLNPAKAGNFNIADAIAPAIDRISVYGIANPATLPARTFIKSFSTPEPAPLPVPDTFYVAVSGVDRMNGSGARFAVAKFSYFLDNVEIFRFTAEAIPFDKGRYINSILEYQQKAIFNRPMVKSWVEPGTGLKSLISSKNEGLLILKDNDVHIVRIELSDHSGNKSTKSFKVKRDISLKPLAPDSTAIKKGRLMPWYLPNTYESGNLRIDIPVGGLCSNILFTADSIKSNGSTIWRVHNNSVPLIAGAKIAIKANVPDALRSKALIAFVSDNGSISSRGGEWKGERLEASLGEFGRYTIAYDTMAPKIVLNLKEKENLSARKNIRITIFDDLSGIASYRAEIDGKWILASYDPKSRGLTIDLDPLKIVKGKSHQLSITVSDGRGNKTNITRNFIW